MHSHFAFAFAIVSPRFSQDFPRAQRTFHDERPEQFDHQLSPSPSPAPSTSTIRPVSARSAALESRQHSARLGCWSALREPAERPRTCRSLARRKRTANGNQMLAQWCNMLARGLKLIVQWHKQWDRAYFLTLSGIFVRKVC